MSDYRLDFNSLVGPGDTDRLDYLLSIVSKDDELEITMDDYSKDQIESITNVLSNNEFNVISKGQSNSGKYHLIVHRKS